MTQAINYRKLLSLGNRDAIIRILEDVAAKGPGNLPDNEPFLTLRTDLLKGLPDQTKRRYSERISLIFQNKFSLSVDRQNETLVAVVVFSDQHHTVTIPFEAILEYSDRLNSDPLGALFIPVDYEEPIPPVTANEPKAAPKPKRPPDTAVEGNVITVSFGKKG